jgi:hypothetical protein
MIAYQHDTLARHPITAEEWQLTLDDLAKKYPAPVLE